MQRRLEAQRRIKDETVRAIFETYGHTEQAYRRLMENENNAHGTILDLEALLQEQRRRVARLEQ